MTGRSPIPLRRIVCAAAVSLLIGLAFVTFAVGYSDAWLVGALQRLAVFAAGAVVLFGGLAWIVLRMADWRAPESEAEFDEVVKRSERLARQGISGEADEDWDEGEDDEDDDFGWDGLDPRDPEDFDRLVELALDDLPVEFRRALERVPVVVSAKGRGRRAYGLYEGDTIARDDYPDRIVIFRDTLVRDFGHDAQLLRAQVTRTVRHELAHHLGWDESGVRGLGL
ncbi:MAG: metallopeptidase family protein [Solirubrobacteraceae bacterium]